MNKDKKHDQSKLSVISPMSYNASQQGQVKNNKDVTIKEWKEIAHVLWKLLDDIDTASDIFRPEMNSFYHYTMKKVEKRFEQMGSDGYNLYVRLDRKEK